MISEDDAREALRLIREAMCGLATFLGEDDEKRAEVAAYTVGTITQSLMVLDLFLTRRASLREVSGDGRRVVGLVSAALGADAVFILSDNMSTLRVTWPTKLSPESVTLTRGSLKVRERWAAIDDEFSQPREFPPP